MKNPIIALLVLPVIAGMALTSCGKKEYDDLAKAQACLDKVPESDPAQADNCMTYVEKYTSQQADILKCSIKMTSGGLVENKIVQAYKALKDTAQTNKTAAYMAALSLDVPDADAGYTKAVAANVFCQASGVPGLMYISSLIVSGSYMNRTIKDLTGNGVNINDPAALNTAVTNMLASCTTNPPDPKCTTDLPTLGTTVMTVANSYCSGTSADKSVCSSVNSAVTSANNDPAQVGQALFCYLKNMKYDPTTKACQ